MAALCQAVGAVISRQVLTTTDIDPADASLIRLIGGLGIIIILMIIRKKAWLPVTNAPVKVWGIFAIATFFGTFAALYLQMVAFTYTKAAIVQTLFATSVILSLVIAWIVGERVNRKTVLWSVVALLGVIILLMNN